MQQRCRRLAGTAALATMLTMSLSCTRRPAPIADVPIAANAGAYFAFKAADNATVTADPHAALAIDSLGPLLAGLGLDPFDPSTRTRLGADNTRPTVVSWMIVDAARFDQLLAAETPPAPGTPFAAGVELVLPVVDPRAAAEAIAALVDPSCARPADAATWSVWLPTLPDAERPAAATVRGEYACSSEFGAVVARLDRERKWLSWVHTIGMQGAWAAAAVLPPRSPELAARLREQGFFTAKFAHFTTRAEAARGNAVLPLYKILAGFEGLDPQDRARLWSKAKQEIGEFTRFVDSKPQLFASYLQRGNRMSWQLTAEGAALFAAAEVKAAPGGAELAAVLARRVEPEGFFSPGHDRDQTVKILGVHGLAMAKQFLWPHALAGAARHIRSQVTMVVDQAAFRGLRWHVEGQRLILEPPPIPAAPPGSR